MKLSLIFASALSLALAATACGGSSAGDGPPGPVSFAADPDSEGAVVFLRGRADGNRVHVDVLARGVANVHGTAFRVKWDPEALGFIEAQPSDAWSKQAVLLAKEALPGQLAVAWTEKGDAVGHDATSALVLGTLVFEAKSRKGTRLTFRTERSTVLDHQGKRVSVAWRAGSIPAR